MRSGSPDPVSTMPRAVSQRTFSVASAIAAGMVLLGTAAPLVAVGGAMLLVMGWWLAPRLVCPAIVLSLPFYLHPRALAGQELSVTEMTILLAIPTTVASGLAARAGFPRLGANGEQAPHWPAPHRVDWLVAGFLLAALLSLLVTEYPKQSARELRWLVVEPLVVLYLARATLRTPTDLYLTLGSVIVAGAIASVAAWMSLAGAQQLLDPGARATSPYLSANHLGLVLGRAAMVALAWVLFGPRGALPLGALVLTALTVLRTVSLGAWLGVAAATAALAAVRSRMLLGATLVGFVLVLVLALLVLPPERTFDRLDPARGTGLLRLQLWDSSLRMIADHPLLGVGLDNFLYQYRTTYIREDAWEEPNLSHPHNWALHFWLQLGILGLASFLGIIGWMGQRSRRAIRSPRGPTERLVGAAVLGMLIDLLVHGLVDNSYFLVDAAVLFWLGVGLLIALDAGAANPAGAR